MFLIKRSWRRLAELLRPRRREPTDFVREAADPRGSFRRCDRSGLAIAERVGLIGGHPWFVAACVSACLRAHDRPAVREADGRGVAPIIFRRFAKRSAI